jgi:hypothetical protein
MTLAEASFRTRKLVMAGETGGLHDISRANTKIKSNVLFHAHSMAGKYLTIIKVLLWKYED